MKFLACLLASALVCFAAREKFDAPALETVMVPMRDGVKLATDLYRPARAGRPAEGRFPALVERTPYNKVGRRKLGDFLARRGYVVVLQDSRGRYASEGEFHPFLDEGKDGYDAIEWAAAQPWCDGKVGTFGGSYTGMDQYHASMYRPPHLVAMFVQMAGANLYQSVSYPGGTPATDWLMWLTNSAKSSPQAAAHPTSVEAIDRARADLRAWLFQPPRSRAAILRDFPVYARYYQDFFDHPAFDDYWKQRGFYTAGYYSEMKDVPTLFITGWYDVFMQGTLDAYMALSRAQKSEKKLMVGPWPHGIGTPECGGAFFGGPRTTEDQAALVADWFDHLLRQEPFDLLSSAPVEIYRMGGGDATRTAKGKLNIGGEWRTAPAWPPPAGRPTRYYLHAGATLDGIRPAAGEPSRYEFDPMHPAPTVGGRNNVLPGSPYCVQDQGPPARRPDILAYTTAPLGRPLELTGRIRAMLWIASDAPDTDITATLADVYPGGYAANLADGQLRARYRNGFEKPEKMQAGTTYEIGIDLGSTSAWLPAGHRLRVDISSGNFPKFTPNPGTGDWSGWWTRLEKAHNTVYHDPAHPSYVELPVIPADR